MQALSEEEENAALVFAEASLKFGVPKKALKWVKLLTKAYPVVLETVDQLFERDLPASVEELLNHSDGVLFNGKDLACQWFKLAEIYRSKDSCHSAAIYLTKKDLFIAELDTKELHEGIKTLAVRLSKSRHVNERKLALEILVAFEIYSSPLLEEVLKKMLTHGSLEGVESVRTFLRPGHGHKIALSTQIG